MERRQDSLVPSVLSAGTDPAHVPGLDEPAAVRPEETPAPAAGPAEDEAPEASAQDDDAATDAREEDVGEEDAGEPAPEQVPEGPSFEVSDHRGAIAADGRGVVFRLDDTEARLGWEEIGAVEVAPARLGRRFSVTVYTTNHRCFDGDVQAPARKDLRAWTADFDAVLDAWFDPGESTDESTGKTPSEEKEPAR